MNEVYLLTSYADRERQAKANEIVELPAEIAQRLINTGQALPIDPVKRTPIRELVGAGIGGGTGETKVRSGKR